MELLGNLILHSARESCSQGGIVAQALHYKTSKARGTGRWGWMLLITMYYRNCVLGKLQALQKPAAGEAVCMAGVRHWEGGCALQEPERQAHQHWYQKKTPFLLKCFSCTPYWQSLTLPTDKGKIFKRSRTLFREQAAWVNLELRSNILTIGTPGQLR